MIRRAFGVTLRGVPLPIDRDELERLANLSASLIVNCHRARREELPVSGWDDLLEALDGVAVIVIRNRVMQGDLKAAAQFLIQPQSRAACAMTFLAEIEQHLAADDVLELRALWIIPAMDITESFDKALREQ